MSPVQPRNAFEALLRPKNKRRSEASLPDSASKRHRLDKVPAPGPQPREPGANPRQCSGGSHQLSASGLDPMSGTQTHISPSTAAEPDNGTKQNSQLPHTAKAVQGANAFTKLMSMRPLAPANVTFTIQQNASGQWGWSWTQHRGSKASRTSEPPGSTSPTGQHEQAAIPISMKSTPTGTQASTEHAVSSASAKALANGPHAADQPAWEAQVKLQLPEHLLTQVHSSAVPSVSNTATQQTDSQKLQPASDKLPATPSNPQQLGGQDPGSLAQSLQSSMTSQQTMHSQEHRGSAPASRSEISVRSSVSEADPTAKRLQHTPKLRQVNITLHGPAHHAASDCNGISWSNTRMRSNQRTGRTYHGTPALLKSALQKCVRRGLADQAVRWAQISGIIKFHIRPA